MELFKAMNQWSTRPADERFWTLQEAHQATLAYRRQAGTKAVPYADLRVEAEEGEINLVGRAKVPARLTHWAFGQLASKVGAPAGYLRGLPATLAAQNLNHGLKSRGEGSDDEAHLLFHQNGDLLLRAALSERYDRIWNSDVIDRMVALEECGWRVPPARPAKDDPRARPATAEDVLRHSQRNSALAIREGDSIAPAGVYASDHDLFVFMVDEDHLVEDGRGNALARGFFCWNSEVGATSLGFTTFLYSAICGNHIVWGASGVREISIRHVGKAAQKFQRVQLQLREYADESASDDQARIKRAQTIELGATPTEVLDALLGVVRKHRIDLPQKLLAAGYDRAVQREDRYGSPRTPWAVVNGLTEVSQETAHADERARIDRAAGKLAAVLF